MDCKDFEALIDAYLDNELTRSTKEEFTAHFSSCEKCRQELAFAESVKRTLSSLPELEVPADFNEKLNKRLLSEKKQRPALRFVARYGTLAACIIIAVVIGHGLTEKDFSNELDFSNENITFTNDLARGVTPTEENKESDEKSDNSSTIITPRGAENSPAETPATGKSRMAEALTDDTAAATALVEAYELDEADETQNMVLAPIVITADETGVEFAKELALTAATFENGVYTMSREKFDNFISALETVGIDFTLSRVAVEDTIIFKIVTT